MKLGESDKDVVKWSGSEIVAACRFRKTATRLIKHTHTLAFEG